MPKAPQVEVWFAAVGSRWPMRCRTCVGTWRRRILSLVLALVVPVTAANGAAGAPGSRTWRAFYDGPNGLDDSASGVAVAPNGGAVFVTGTSYNTTDFPSETDIATVAYDADTGHQLWAMRWDGSGEHDDGLAVAVTPDSATVIVAGLSQKMSRPRVVTIAYDAVDGSELWSRRFLGPDRGESSAALAISLDGSTVFVAGASEGAEPLGLPHGRLRDRDRHGVVDQPLRRQPVRPAYGRRRRPIGDECVRHRPRP